MAVERSRLRILCGVAAVLLPAIWAASSSVAAPVQVASSDDGVFAQGYVPDAAFDDGSTRAISVTLAVPRGAVRGTSVVGPVDFARPWAVVSETIVSDPASDHATNGTEVCNEVSNPERWDAGSPGRNGEAWIGTSVDVRCGDGSEYLFYRVHWDPGPYWIVTNPVLTLWMGGQATSWSSHDMRGTVELWPTANQQTKFTVCGHRTETDLPRDVDCFGKQSGQGVVVPSTSGMVVQAVAVG